MPHTAPVAGGPCDARRTAILRPSALQAWRSPSAAQPRAAGGPRRRAPLPPAAAASTTDHDAPATTTPSANTSAPGASPLPAVRGARVQVRDMVKHFKTKKGVFKAVDGVSVDLEPGTITALLGPSGSGKTTLLRLIAGLEEPTSGHVAFDGVDVTGLPVQDRNLGIVFQGYALFKHMTAAGNIAFGPRIRRMPGDLDAKVQALLELIELEELGGRYPPQLSGGQKQRVAVARALACDPQVLLLDEPFGALDPLVRKSLRQGLKGIVQRLGVTTIMVTHDQEEAWDIADSVVVFNRGVVEQAGTPAALAAAPASPFVMNFVGDVLHLPATCQLARRAGVDAGGKTHVMVRPGDLSLDREFGEPGLAAATVADKANVGWAVRYWLRFDDGAEVEIGVGREEDERRYDLEVGQRVAVRADPAKMMAFDYADLDSINAMG